MKTTLSLLMLVLVVLQPGCATYQPKTQFGKKVAAWWNDPGTQEKVQIAGDAAGQFLFNAGLGAATVLLNGGNLDKGALTKVAISSGALTLYQTASSLRQLQGTTQVLDPIATATVLQQTGTPSDAAKQIALQVIAQIQQNMAKGQSADQAAESVAQNFDTPASIAALGATK
ncbi:hypothetical protein BH09VER1_BH09VER1_28560 [soil metagenome]